MAELGRCLACSTMGCRQGQAFVPSSVELRGVKGEAMGTPCLLRPCLHHVTPSVTHKGHPPPPSKATPLQSPLRLSCALLLAPHSPSHASQGSWSPVPQTQHPEVGGEVSCSLSIRSRPLSPVDAQTTWMGPRSERGLREDKAGGGQVQAEPTAFSQRLAPGESNTAGQVPEGSDWGTGVPGGSHRAGGRPAQSLGSPQRPAPSHPLTPAPEG